VSPESGEEAGEVGAGGGPGSAWRQLIRLGQCSGMTSDDLTLDLAATDEFAVVGQSFSLSE
jgi:hypothetical protein